MIHRVQSDSIHEINRVLELIQKGGTEQMMSAVHSAVQAFISKTATPLAAGLDYGDLVLGVSNSLVQLSRIASDGWLSSGEKSSVLRDWNDLDGSKPLLVAQCATTPVILTTDYVQSWQDLGDMLNGGTTYVSGTPLWLQDMTVDTVIPDTAIWISIWANAYAQRIDIQNKLAQRAKDIADQAEIDAQAALTAIGYITNDNIVSDPERPTLKRLWVDISNQVTVLAAKAVSYTLTGTTEYTNLMGASGSWSKFQGGTIPHGIVYQIIYDSSGNTNITASPFSITAVAFNGYWSTIYTDLSAMYAMLSSHGIDLSELALADLAKIASDGWLSRGEKAQAIKDWNDLNGSWSDLLTKATHAGASSTAFNTAMTTLQSYLNGLSPAWNDTTQDTAINATTWNTDWTSAYSERVKLINTMSQLAFDSAGSALADLIRIASDSWLSRGEKPGVVKDWNDLNGSWSDLISKASSAGVSSTAFNNAMTALQSYLGGLSPAYTDATQDTAIVSATWLTKWSDAYSERIKLINTITAAAQADADTAIADLAKIASDGWLSKGEKPQALKDWNDLNGSWADLISKASSAGVSSTAFNNAMTALQGYLTGLTPSWTDNTADTAIVAATWNADWSAAYTERVKLINALTLAAQSDADLALADLVRIGSDSWLSKGEKPQAVKDWNDLNGSWSDLLARALAVSVSSTAFNSAMTALQSYLVGLTPTWSDTSADTAIVASTWNTDWSNAYTERIKLINAVTNAAQTAANTAIADLAKIGSDGWLSKGEKPQAVKDWNDLYGSWSDLITKGTSAGVSTTAFNDAMNTLQSYLGGLTPTWTDTSSDTAINATTWAADWTAAYTERVKLMNMITLAAQDDANSALNKIASISSDGIISDAERPMLKMLRTSLSTEVAAAQSRTPASLTGSIEYTTLTSKWAFFESGGAAYVIIFGSGDTTITKATFDGYWSDVYTALANLYTKISQTGIDIANSKIQVFFGNSTTYPTGPTASTVGDLWVDTTNTQYTLWRWNGTAWAIVQDSAYLFSLYSSIADDGILTISEKRAVYADWEAAVAENTNIVSAVARTGSASLATAYSASYTALLNMITGVGAADTYLSPPYPSVSGDSIIPKNGATSNTAFWNSIWTAYRRDKADLLVKLGNIATPKIDGIIPSSVGNVSLTTNASSTWDGHAFAAGNKIMLWNQTDPTQDGIYTLAYSSAPSSSTQLYVSSTSHSSGTGSITNAANAYDNDADYALVAASAISAGSGTNAYSGVFSGFSTTSTAGTLTVDFEVDGGEFITADYTTDAGVTWLPLAMAGHETGVYAASLSTGWSVPIVFTSVTVNNIWVRFSVFYTRESIYDEILGRTRYYISYASAQVKSVRFDTAVLSTNNYYFVDKKSVSDQSAWNVTYGTVYAGHKWIATVNGSGNITAITDSGEASSAGSVSSVTASAPVTSSGGTAPNIAIQTNPSFTGVVGVDEIQFNTSPTVTPAVGLTYWDSTNMTLATVLDATNGVTLQHGQEIHLYVKNTSGAIIADGAAVYISGAQGNHPTIAKAKADSISTCQVVGITTQAFPINGFGYITLIGDVHGFDASVFSGDGHTLYLSATTAGAITDVAPASPNYLVTLGTNLNTTNNGAIAVAVSRPIALDTALTANSSVIAPSQAAVKAYADTKQPALGFTPVNKAGDTGIGALSMGALTATSGTFTAQGFHTFGNDAGTQTVIVVNGASGNTKNIQFRTANGARWLVGANAVAESTGDAGTGFVVSAYTDASALIDSPLSIIRAAGGTIAFSSARPVTMGALTATSVKLSSSTYANMQYSSSAGLCILGATGGTYDFNIQKADGSAYIMTIPTGTNSVTFSGSVSMGALTATSGTFSSTLSATADTSMGGALANGSIVARFLTTGTGDRLRIRPQASGSGVILDVTDSGETTQARAFTVASPVTMSSTVSTGALTATSIMAQGTPSGSLAANRVLLQNEGASITRMYFCGADASTYGKFELYGATSAAVGRNVLTILQDGSTTFNGYAVSTGALTATSGTFSAKVKVTSNDFQIDGSYSGGGFFFSNGGVSRWYQYSINAETGSNAGYDWVLRPYSDAGGSLPIALTITRSTGAATFAGSVSTGLGTVYTNSLAGVVLGYVNDSTSGWGAYGIGFGSASGQHSAIAHAGTTLYFGIENGTAGTLNTWLSVAGPTNAATFAGTVAAGSSFGVPTESGIGWGNPASYTDYLVGSTTSHNIRLFTNSTERMRIDSSGNVGIGTTAPGAKLTLSQDADIAVRFDTTSANVNARNWAVVNSHIAYGDFSIRRSTTLGGDPVAGASVLYFDHTGAATFASSVTATDYRFPGTGYITFDTGGAGTSSLVIREGGTAKLTFAPGGAATFASSVGINGASPAVGWALNVHQADTQLLRLNNTTGYGTTILFGDQGWAARIVHSGGELRFQVNDTTTALTLVGSGATFASSVTAKSASLWPTTNFFTNATARQLLIGESSDNAGYKLALGYFYESGLFKAGIQATAGGTGCILALNADGGNVGIGTTAPNSGGGNASWLTINAISGSTYSGGLSYAINGVNQCWAYQDNDNKFTHQGTGSNAGFKWVTGSTTTLSITATGDATFAGNIFTTATDSTVYDASSYQDINKLTLANSANVTGSTCLIRFTGYGANEAFFGTVRNASGYADLIYKTYSGSYSEKFRIASTGAATFAGTVRTTASGGLALGEVASVGRLRYGIDGTYMFGFVGHDGNYGNLSMGALTATTGAFSGALYMNSATQTLDRSSNDLRWRYDGANYGILLHTGNVGSNAATFQAAVASATAPLVGTIAQRTAYTPATGTTPYWYATDETASDGKLGTLRQWTGSAWGAEATPQTVVGRVVAGVISAGAVGAQALAANIVTTGVITSTGAALGTATTAPVGFTMTGTPYTSTCLNAADGSSVTLVNTVLELGGGVNFGGYPLSTLAIAKLVNGGIKEYTTAGTYSWKCPTGITKIEITLQGGGASGHRNASGGGGGGAGSLVRKLVDVTPGTTYSIVVGAGGAGTTSNTGNAGASSTGMGVTAAGGSSSFGINGGGAGAYQAIYPGVMTLLRATGAGGGGANTDGYGCGDFIGGFAGGAAGGGGASAMANGGTGATGGTADSGTIGSGGGGTVSGTSGAGGAGYALLRW